MITVFIALVVAFAAGAAARLLGDWGWAWSIVAGAAGFGVFQAAFGLAVRRRITRDMEQVQRILVEGQKQIQQKMQRWQMRPPSSMQAAQAEVFNDTKAFVKAALAQVETLDRYRLWVPLIGRQMATAKVQLCWMIKDFKTVDALMPKVLLVDPALAAIKMARMHMTKAPVADILKVYRKAVRRVRYNGNVLPAAAMSWIQVKSGDADGAFKTLTEALKRSDDATLKRNREHLMNDRVTHFSNSGLGDQWYSLLLEEPKMRTQRQRGVYR